MDIVSDEGKTSNKFFHFGMIYFGTAEQYIPTGGSD